MKGGGESTLLTQIQDQLQSSRERYFGELEGAKGRSAAAASRSVVCEEDANTSPALSANITNTALLDSKVDSLIELWFYVPLQRRGDGPKASTS